MTLTPSEVEAVAVKLTKAQRGELRRVRDDDQGAMARGDPSGLTYSGLANAPMDQGFYTLTPLGLAVRAHLKDHPNG